MMLLSCKTFDDFEQSFEKVNICYSKLNKFYFFRIKMLIEFYQIDNYQRANNQVEDCQNCEAMKTLVPEADLNFMLYACVENLKEK